MISNQSRYLMLAVSIALGAAGSEPAAAQDLIYPMDAGLVAVPADAAVPRPEYLVPAVDPKFKTRITRVTDEADAATPRLKADASAPDVIRHNYSKSQPWNSDGSLLRLGGFYLLDGKTYKRVGTYSEYSSETFWSHTQPNIMLTFQPPAPATVASDGTPMPAVDGALRRATLTKIGNAWSQTGAPAIKTFPFGQPYEEMFAGRWEGRPSEDDRYIAFMARKRPDGAAASVPANILEIFVLDTTTGTVQGRKEFGALWAPGTEPPLDWCSVSPSGKYVVLAWKATGPAANQGVEVYTRPLTNGFPYYGALYGRRQLVEKTEHGDLCWEYNAAGSKDEEVWVQVITGVQEGQYNADLAAWRLRSSAPIRRILPRPASIDFGGHVSCTNYNRPGWAYITPDSEAQYTGAPSHVFATKIQDNTNLGGAPIPVEPFAHHRSNSFLPNAPEGYNYASQPHGVADPAGFRVMFASNWHASSTPTNIYSYVAERPKPVQLVPAAPPAPQAVVLSSATAQMRFNRLAWQAMVLKTPRGVEIPATDLLLYATSAANQSELPAAYWMGTADQTVSFSEMSAHGDAYTAVISASRSGVTKVSYVTVYPDDPLFYVVTRLTTDHAIGSVYDNQLTYVNNSAASGSMHAAEVWLDGVQRIQQEAVGSSRLFAYLGTKNASLAILMAPANQQKLKLSQPLFYQYFAGPGSNLAVRGLGNQPLNPGELIEYRYAIYWNDGNTRADVDARSAQMQAHALDGKFRAP
jgi:hypothetical protein